MAMLKKMKQWLVLLLTFPAAASATDNPFDVMGIQQDIEGQDIVSWFKGLLQSEYMPLILGAVGLMILASSAMHIHHGIKKAREEGSQVALTDFSSSLIAAIIGIAIIGLGFNINSGW